MGNDWQGFADSDPIVMLDMRDGGEVGCMGGGWDEMGTPMQGFNRNESGRTSVSACTKRIDTGEHERNIAHNCWPRHIRQVKYWSFFALLCKAMYRGIKKGD